MTEQTSTATDLDNFLVEADYCDTEFVHRFGECDWRLWPRTMSLPELIAAAREHAAACDGSRTTRPPMTAEEDATAQWMRALWEPVIKDALRKPLLFNELQRDARGA